MAPKHSDKDRTPGEKKQRKRPGRAPVSCAECRRLKLRCDRKVPCGTCLKRGCSAICPEGSLTTGKGRLALADADELHRKIERLRNRVTTLEDALRTLQAVVTDDPHPLLQDDMVEDKSDSGRRRVSPNPPQLTREDEEFLDAFGTLTLGLRGESRFFGPTARSEYLIHAQEYAPACDGETFPHLSADLVEAACMSIDMPMNCSNSPEIKRKMIALLPSLSRACQLCEIFLEFGEYLWCALPRGQLFDEILGVIYRSAPLEDCGLVSTHAWALLFMVFALATLLDMNVPAYAVEAREYFLISRLALRFAPPVADTTIWAIQTLVYMAIYMELSDKRASHSGSHKAWIHTGLAVKLGHSIGLHVNSARWQLDEEASQRRSRVFWQLFHLDTWVSFGFGRPPCMSLSYVDCELPKDKEDHINSEGQHEWGFHSWTWQYTRLLHTVMTTAFGAKTPPYSTVVDLDRKIRDFPMPWRMHVNCGQPEECSPSNTLRMQRWIVVASKEATLLNLHRPYFAQALNEQPSDLLRHRYGPSVMAIFRSAWRLIEGLRETYRRIPTVLNRLSLPWSQSLSGAIVMCLLATRAPKSSLAESALTELDHICEMFEGSQTHCLAAANHLSIVQSLRKQAHEATQKDHDMSCPELDRFGGKTHLISETTYGPSGGSCAEVSPRPSATASVVDVSTPGGPVPMDSIHPTIMSDMRSFESGQFSAEDIARALNFDLPQFEQQQGPLQPQVNGNGNHPEYRAYPDIYMGEDIFGSVPTPSAFSTATSSSTSTPESITNVSAPVLDATWQSFVEQLGF